MPVMASEKSEGDAQCLSMKLPKRCLIQHVAIDTAESHFGILAKTNADASRQRRRPSKRDVLRPSRHDVQQLLKPGRINRPRRERRQKRSGGMTQLEQKPVVARHRHNEKLTQQRPNANGCNCSASGRSHMRSGVSPSWRLCRIWLFVNCSSLL